MNQLSNLIFIAVLVGAFWFLILRPQQQRQKQQRAMLAALKPGDEIVTVGGIYGTIVSTGDRTRIRVADGSEIEVAPQAIGQVVPPKGAASAEDAQGDEPGTDEESSTDA